MVQWPAGLCRAGAGLSLDRDGKLGFDRSAQQRQFDPRSKRAERHAMRNYRAILVSTILVGCTSTPDVPLPKTTPFDDRPKAQAAYLKAYKQGYREGYAHGYQWSCAIGLTNLTDVAANDGWNSGMIDGTRAKRHELFERYRKD